MPYESSGERKVEATFLDNGTITRDGIALTCPFSRDDIVCGNWCPHFDMNGHGVVRLTCGGQARSIKVAP